MIYHYLLATLNKSSNAIPAVQTRYSLWLAGLLLTGFCASLNATTILGMDIDQVAPPATGTIHLYSQF